MARIKKTHFTAKDITWADAFEMYMLDKERVNLSEQTMKNYRASFLKYNRVFGIDPEQTSTTEALAHTFEEFVDAMRAEHLKDVTINTHTGNIHHFYAWLYDHNFTREARKCIYLKTDDTLPRFLSDDDVEALVNSPYRSDDFVISRTYTLICLMLSTGIRVGSVPMIEITDWDKDEETLTLRKTKTRKQQMIYLPSSASSVLEAYYFDFISGAKTRYLFPNINGDMVSTKALQEAYRKFCVERGVANTHIHSLRHTFATNWVKRGGNLYKLQKALNHKSQVSTIRYARLFDEDIARDFESLSILNDYISPKQRIIKKGRKRP